MYNLNTLWVKLNMQLEVVDYNQHFANFFGETTANASASEASHNDELHGKLFTHILGSNSAEEHQQLNLMLHSDKRTWLILNNMIILPANKDLLLEQLFATL